MKERDLHEKKCRSQLGYINLKLVIVILQNVQILNINNFENQLLRGVNMKIKYLFRMLGITVIQNLYFQYIHLSFLFLLH